MSDIRENIYFLGSRTDMDRLYQAMDVFVLPSRYEGLPVVGVEAQAEGLPCVLSSKMTGEVKITNNCRFASIEEDSSVWAEMVLKYKGEKRHSGNMNKLFDIKEQAEKMVDYYNTLMNAGGKA